MPFARDHRGRPVHAGKRTNDTINETLLNEARYNMSKGYGLSPEHVSALESAGERSSTMADPYAVRPRPYIADEDIPDAMYQHYGTYDY